jgi:hypothetical protein
MQQDESGAYTLGSRSWRYFYAIGLVAAATIFCEIALTRLFSVVQYYHGAFLAVSLALFGFAVSGVFVFLRGERFTRHRLDASVAFYATCLAASIPLCFFFYLYVGIEPLFQGLGLGAGASLVATLLEYALLAVPFFCSGVCISVLLLHGARQANRLYAADLTASASGAVLVIPALALFGGPKSMFLASAMAAAAALPFLAALGRLRFLPPALGITVLAGLTLLPASTLNDFRIRKPAFVVASEPIRWNSFSMVGVTPEEALPFAKRERGGRVRQHRGRKIVIDNSVVTQMVAWNGNLADAQYLRQDFNAAAHRLRRDAKVLIIGSGGGRDILEIFGDFTGHVYSTPDVETVVGDARSYIANSSERFDIILASLIDTWAASAAGAFALTENLLYTTDAFRDYYDHLTDDGVLSISRWHPQDTPRLLATAFEAWREAGVDDPRRHAMIVLTPPIPPFGQISVVLMKKSPLTPEEIRTFEAFCAETNRIVALTPVRVENSVVTDSLAALDEDAANPWPGLDVKPVSDERPFFFNMVKPWTEAMRVLGLSSPYGSELAAYRGNLEATRTLVQLFFGVLLLLCFTILLPLSLRAGSVRGPNWIAVLGYFTCLGLGYLLIEIGLLQRLILLLGKPVYALAVILFTMLLASGAGSYASGRFAQDQLPRALPRFLLLAAALLGVYAVFLPAWIQSLLGSAPGIRFAAAVIVVAIPAFLLGMPFPCGIRLLEGKARGTLIPWVWGINGAMSVLASVSAIILAIQFGYTVVFLLGTLCYAAAALLLLRWASGPALSP